MHASASSDLSIASRTRGVIPEKAGIPAHNTEIPAFAGMTPWRRRSAWVEAPVSGSKSRHTRGSHLPLPGEGRVGVVAISVLKKALAPIFLCLTLATPAFAIDPPYQRQMERLAEVMGSLYYLEPLCKAGTEDWRAQMSELISLDEPDEDRRQRLAGAFNAGYTGFSRLHRQCTPASREALSRLMVEAQQLARSIHTRFAE